MKQKSWDIHLEEMMESIVVVATWQHPKRV
jgi:hypothetical protein